MLARFAILTLVAASPLAAQDDLRTIRGVVVDTSGLPIPGVTLKQKGSRDVVTDDSGQFRLTVKKDAKIALDLRRVGLFPGAFMAREAPDTAIRLTMFARPQVLPATVVVAQRKQLLERWGFYERQRNEAMGGYFITPEDLEKRRPRSVTGAVEGVPGVKIDVGVAGADSPMIQGRNGCIMNVYLDGHRLTPDSSLTVHQRKRAKAKRLDGVIPAGQQNIAHPMNIQIDHLLDVKSILAVEVYPRAIQAPPQYMPPRNDCGVVLLWTTGPER